MRLRLVLPPNIEAAALRDAIPAKLEFQDSEGPVQTPEKTPLDQLGNLSESERVAAFSLLQWCGGSLSSFLQLSKSQLAQLVSSLQGEARFFWANNPKIPIDWNGSELVGVSEHIATGEADAPSVETKPDRQAQEPEPEPLPTATFDRVSFEGTPMLVDGSSHYLSITLPSREHPCYREIRETLQDYRFKLEPSNRKWWLRDRHHVLNFLGRHGGDLEDGWGADFTENFHQRTAAIKEARISSEISEENNGYKVFLSIKAGGASDQEISQSLNSGKNYIESDGKVFLVKKSKLEALHTAQKKLTQDLNAPLLHNGVYKIDYSSSAQVEEELERINPNFKPPATWRDRSRALRDLSALKPAPLSKTLETTLRPYQKTGVSWLYHLFNHKLGGILADEMGLGKTLQALALLTALKGKKRRPGEPPSAPSLVVCPASLVENWRREAAKFTPELRVAVNHGSTRLKTVDALRGVDLVITSYGTLIRDEALLSSVEYRCVIADEAQHIKNRRTRNAKALTALHTDGRFLLTGTPVENSIQDLMSLLDFIMPGGWKGIPNGARGDERRWHEKRIQEQAAPYILRRSKEAVAPELPEKLEQIIYVDMTPEQKATYEKTRKLAESEIAAAEKSGATEGAIRMKTLTQLLRLRQTCCDPRLLDDTLTADSSAKMNSFLELLEEAIDGGHRILVFSQFVSIISLLKEQLVSQDIPFCYIDGSTRNRMAEVDKFQESDEIPIFLISLKAGGTGLNLTAADTVIHFDPWWNPAAEAQATDRAHRIGQTKIVTSYKLIVSDSVEEKVLQLQESKRQLLKDIFDASEAANATIDLADLKSLI